ncbi:hypothetical protein P0082_00090 [Candidatus Haliotispira prima]|uniref:LPXTG cell wall anchor domain-containing protein n=1 Tax=Candidatus Haliotispira prima TaxID=3034016 RepID=A0ABY8MGZ8_9SPIO|nr:hypothetical protein P0082_00090 [Candidatus Haliotispira prima]
MEKKIVFILLNLLIVLFVSCSSATERKLAESEELLTVCREKLRELNILQNEVASLRNDNAALEEQIGKSGSGYPAFFILAVINIVVLIIVFRKKRKNKGTTKA